jgi:hypothetical protein
MIDLTPSKAAYIQMLKIIISDSTNQNDREWAKEELKKWESEQE